MKLSVKLLFAMLAVATLTMPIAGAQGTTGTPPGLQVPARTLPPPGTVSPQMQKIIGAPISPNWKAWPQTPDEWRKFVANAAATVEKGLPAMRDEVGAQRLHVAAIVDGAPGRKPSSEIQMHLVAYRARPDVHAVVHAHPPLSTGFAVAGITVPVHPLALADEATSIIGSQEWLRERAGLPTGLGPFHGFDVSTTLAAGNYRACARPVQWGGTDAAASACRTFTVA